MGRVARSIFPGIPHHLAQRGRGGRIIFEVELDYRRYVYWLREYAERYNVEIWAYCLMPSGIDLVCVPGSRQSLAIAFNTLHMRYSQFLKAKKLIPGPLWLSRFMSCPLDDLTALEDIRSLEMQPVRAGLVAKPEDYAWSSARARVLGEKDLVAAEDCRLLNQIGDWRVFLTNQPDEIALRKVREQLKTGRPAGDGDFVRKLEKIACRRLQAMPRGRPKKESSHKMRHLA
jgi:putative transposase